MQIVRSNSGDAAALTRIALAAKRSWGYTDSWIETWRPLLTITPEFIAQNAVFSSATDGRVIGFYALVQDESTARLEHFLVLPEGMGHGIGRALFAHAVAQARNLGCSAIEIESDPNAEGFYLRMGARRTGARVAEVEGERRELPLLVFDLSG